MNPLDKKRLEDYRLLEQKVKTLERQIAEMEHQAAQYEHATVKGSNPEFPYQPMTFHPQGYNIRYDERKRDRIRNLKSKLEAQKTEAEKQRLEIQEWVADIQDTTVRLIFTYKYLDRLTFRQIGRKLHIDPSNVCRKIDNFLKSQQMQQKT